MKKLGRKLILSAVALGAVATTAVSTTFAWYVSNDTVSASGITGKTNTADSDALQISTDGSQWSSSVTLDTSSQSFQPVYYSKTSDATNGYAKDTYYSWGEDAVSKKESTAYLKFDLYFRNLSQEKAGKVYLKSFQLTNTTTSLPSANLMGTIGSISDQGTYTVDLIRTLRTNITPYTYTVDAANKGVDGNTSYNTGEIKSYQLGGYHVNTGTTKDTLDETNASGYNAHSYYNFVRGLEDDDAISTDDNDGNASATELSTTTTAIELGDAYNLNFLKVTFVIYEAGWSKACFDAVKGQTISIAMDFTTSSSAAFSKTVTA